MKRVAFWQISLISASAGESWIPPPAPAFGSHCGLLKIWRQPSLPGKGELLKREPSGPQGESSDHTLRTVSQRTPKAQAALLPYLALYFHPRNLVSVLLQSEGTHQEWEANPSFLLHNETKHHNTRRLFQVCSQQPNSSSLSFLRPMVFSLPRGVPRPRPLRSLPRAVSSEASKFSSGPKSSGPGKPSLPLGGARPSCLGGAPRLKLLGKNNRISI